MSRKKTLLVGFDAACWHYLDALLQSDQLPILRDLMADGISGSLHSTMPPWTPTAWSSIVTGKNPGKHGIFDMLWRFPGSYNFMPTNGNLRNGKPFWKYLNDRGIKVGLINIPFTYPPESVEGFLVSGFGTPITASQVTFPHDLRSWIQGELGNYSPVVKPAILKSSNPERIFSEERKHQANLVQIANLLLERFDIDVLVINLMLADHANHKMPSMEKVEEAYRETDLDVGKLLDSFQPDNVMLISDHGSNRIQGDFLLGAWLRDEGYFVTEENSANERSKAINWVLMQWLKNLHEISGYREKVLRSALRGCTEVLPKPVTNKFIGRMAENIPFADQHILFNDKPNFQKTKIFPSSVYSGLLYLNLIGREPSGVVSEDEYSGLASEIISKLSQIEEPETGLPVFTNIYKSGDIYFGPATDQGPDLILDSYDRGWNIRSSKYVPIAEKSYDRYFVDVLHRTDYGWHSRDGIFIFSGSDFVSGSSYIDANVMDIPATLLHVYGIPIPEDFDGSVLTELLADGLSQMPVEYQVGDSEREEVASFSISDEENEAMVEHLRALGYLE